VLLAAVLKEMGYKLRLFVGDVDETTLRSLQVLCGQPVTLLDPTLCERRESLRWLFQEAASPDALNLVLTSLGTRRTKGAPFRVTAECKLLLDWLECEMIPVVYSDTSSVIAVKAIGEIISQLENDVEGDLRIHSLIFRSILNNREYELLHREVGRRLTAMSAGSIPRMLERDEPLITDLCSENAAQCLFSIRSAARQLRAMDSQIDWALFSAFGLSAANWKKQPKSVSPIQDADKMNIAVIRDPALTLGGDGTERLLRALGCNIVDIPLDVRVEHAQAIHGVYIPHGLGYMTVRKFFSNLYAKTLISRGMTGESFMLAEGGAAPLMGDRISLPYGTYGTIGGGDGLGFGALPFNGVYDSPMFDAPQKMIAMSRKKLNPLLTGSQEWVWGYCSRSVRIEPRNNEDFCWSIYENLMSSKEASADAMAKGRMLVTSMRIEPWSTPETFKRWLEGGI
jgi:cobyrinic acid a,c-diamide synthase